MGIDDGGLAFLVQMYKEFRPKVRHLHNQIKRLSPLPTVYTHIHTSHPSRLNLLTARRQLMAQFPDKPFLMDSREVALNGRAFAAFLALLQPQENKYLVDYFTQDAIRERLDAAKAKAAAALAAAQPPAPVAAAPEGAAAAGDEKKVAEPVKTDAAPTTAAVAAPAAAAAKSEAKEADKPVKLPASLLVLAPASPQALSPAVAAAVTKAPPLKTKEEMVPLAAFVSDDGPTGLAAAGLSLEANSSRRTPAAAGEGLVLPRARTVAVSNIPRGATSAQLTAQLTKFGAVRPIASV